MRNAALTAWRATRTGAHTIRPRSASPALPQRILGIDPGLRATGYGVIESAGAQLRYIASGCIRSGSGELAPRIAAILNGLRSVIEQFAPAQIALEKVFVNVNPQSTLLLGQARGAAICAAVLQELSVAEYTALQVKQAVVGNGHADKRQIQDMVRRLLLLNRAPQADAADALAVAICHAHSGKLGQLELSGTRVRRGRIIALPQEWAARVTRKGDASLTPVVRKLDAPRAPSARKAGTVAASIATAKPLGRPAK